MKHPTLYLITFEILLSFQLKAQQVTNVTLRSVGDAIDVTYDLSGPGHLRMNIAVVFIEKSSGLEIVPKTTFGDLIEVAPGKRKKITWLVLSDRHYLDEEIKATLTISAIRNAEVPGNNFSSPGGPGNAFLSVMMPGLGDVFVNGDEKPVFKPAYITMLFLASAGLAWYCHNESENYYQSYQSSVQQYEINSNYDKAVYYANNAKLMAGIAGAIWAVDVIRVASKGFSNRRKGVSHQSNGQLSLRTGLTTATLIYRF